MVGKAKGADASVGKRTEDPKKKKKRRQDFPNLPEEQLREFVLAYLGGGVFTSAKIPKGQEADLLPMIFIPVALGAFSRVRRQDLKHIGILWEYLNKALPRSINGFPMFASCRVLNRSDWDRARKAINAELGRRKDLKV